MSGRAVDTGLDKRGRRHWQVDWACGCVQTLCEESAAGELEPGSVFPLCGDREHWAFAASAEDRQDG